MLPGMDHPEAFGQHPNADITSQIQETRRMFDTLLSLQAASGATASADNREEKVSRLLVEIILYLEMCRSNIIFTCVCMSVCMYTPNACMYT